MRFKRYKFIIGIGIVLFLSVIFFIIVMPLILNKIYYSDSQSHFFEVNFSLDTILGYYGTVLTFIGTTLLGAITVYQNHIAQKKTDEVNRLTLELQNKVAFLAEEQYKQVIAQSEKNVPKFELQIDLISGYYKDLRCILKNVSDTIVSGINHLSFGVVNELENITTVNVITKIKKSSLSSGEATTISFSNIALNGLGNDIFWRFKCEDSYGNVFYYKATIHIDDVMNPKKDSWIIKRVG